MEKTYKRMPFDIELAKDIQSGKVEGRIVTSENLLVRIVDFNLKDKTDSIVYIGTYANGEREFIQTCDNKGKSFGVNVLDIELPEEAPKQNFQTIEESNAYAEGYANGYKAGKYEPKHEFKPFDKVLVRDTEDFRAGCEQVWVSRLYDYKDAHNPDKLRHWCQDGCSYTDCIPYEGNEHLVGTTDNPE